MIRFLITALVAASVLSNTSEAGRHRCCPRPVCPQPCSAGCCEQVCHHFCSPTVITLETPDHSAPGTVSAAAVIEHWTARCTFYCAGDYTMIISGSGPTREAAQAAARNNAISHGCTISDYGPCTLYQGP
jgi:hypothetical protein